MYLSQVIENDKENRYKIFRNRELAKIFFINTSWSSIQRPHTIFSIKIVYLLMQTINLA